MDVLSDVLGVVRLSGAVFFKAEFSAPWAIESKRELLAPIVKPEVECVVLFHILVDGECIVECGALPAVRMEAGDVIVFPHGDRAHHAESRWNDDDAHRFGLLARIWR